MADRSLVTCQGCQEPVSPGQHFCGNCGLRVTSSGKRPCPHCQKLIKATAKFCPKCRNATNIVAVRRCTCCGEEAESDEDEYCSGCAEPLPPLLKGSPVQKTIVPTVTQLSSDEQVQSLADTPVRPGSGGDGEVSEAPGQDTATFPEDVPGSIAVKQVSEVKVGRSPTAQAQSEKPTDKTGVKRVNDSVGKVATRPRHQGEQYQGEQHQGEQHQGEQYQRMQHHGEQYQGEQSALPVSQTEFSHSATSDISLNRKRNGQNDLNMNNDLVQRKLVRLNIDPEKEIRKDLSGSEAGLSPQGEQRMAPGALGMGTPPGGNGHNVPGLSGNAPVQTQEKYSIQEQGVADQRPVANRQGEGATDQRPVANRQGEGATDQRPVANRRGEGATDQRPVANRQGEGATDQRPVANRQGGGATDQRPVANRQGEGATDQRPVANRQGEGATDQRPVANRQGEGATDQRPVANRQGEGATDQRPVANRQGEGATDQRPVANRQGGGATDQRPVANRQGEGATDQRPVANRQGEGATDQRPVANRQGEGATDQRPGTVGRVSEAIDQENGSTSQQHRSHSYKSEVNIHMKSYEELEGKEINNKSTGLGQQDKDREIKSEENTVNDGKCVFGQSVHPDVGRDTSGKDVPLFGPMQTEHGSMMSDECADTRRGDDNGNVVTSGEHSMKTRSQTKAATNIPHPTMNQGNKTYADAIKKGGNKEKKESTKTEEAKSQPKKNVGQRQQEKRYQKNVSVIFHVVIPPLWKWKMEEEKICILFGHRSLGNWGETASNDKYRMQIEHDIGDGYYLLRGEVSVPKDCLLKGNQIMYKYVLISNKEPDKCVVKYEHLYFNIYTKGFIANRHLGIKTSILEKTDEWHQYDCTMLPDIKKRNFMEGLINWVKGSDKDFEQMYDHFIFGATKMLPAWEILCEDKRGSEMQGEKVLEEIENVEKLFCKLLRPELQNEARKALLYQYFSTRLEELNNWQEKEETVRESGRRMVSAVTIMFLTMRYNLPFDEKFINTICEALLIRPHAEKKICNDLELVFKHFPNYIIQIKDRLLSFIQICARSDAQKWLFLVPLWHFLNRDMQPYEKITDSVSHDDKNNRWWGTSGIYNTAETFKDKMNYPNYLQVGAITRRLAPLFEVDRLLPRTLATTFSARHLEAMVETGAFPPEVCLAVLVYYVRKLTLRETLMERRILVVLDAVGCKIQQMSTQKEIHAETEDLVVQLKQCTHICEDLFRSVLNYNTKASHYKQVSAVLQTLFTSMAALKIAAQANTDQSTEAQVYGRMKEVQEWVSTLYATTYGTLTQWLGSPQVLPTFMCRTMYSTSLQEYYELELWSSLFQLHLLEDQHTTDFQHNLAKKLEERIRPLSNRQKVSLYCDNDFSKLHPNVEHCFSEPCFQAICDICQSDKEERSFLWDSQSDGDSANYRLRHMLSKVFRNAWPTQTADENTILKHILRWPSFSGFVRVYLNSGERQLLENETGEHMQLALVSLNEFVGNLLCGDITVEQLQLLLHSRQSFLELCKILLSQTPPILECVPESDLDGIDKCQVLLKIISYRERELEQFNKTRSLVNNFITMCKEIQPVDTTRLEKIVEKNPEKLKIRQICTPRAYDSETSSAEYKPHCVYFALPDVVQRYLEDMNQANKSNLFVELWKHFGIRMHKLQENENQENVLTIEQVVVNVFHEAFKRWQAMCGSMQDGSITLTEVDYIWQLCRDEEDVLREELSGMTPPPSPAHVDRILKQVRQYLVLRQYMVASTVLLNMKDACGLTGDFSPLEDIQQVVRDKRSPLNMIRQEVMSATEDMEGIDEQKVECLTTFMKCLRLVAWLKENLSSGTKEVKVLVDLAMIRAAGQGDLEVEKVSILHASVTGYAPLIYDLQENADYKDLLLCCRNVWRQLETDPKLPSKLRDVDRLLDWLKEVNDSHGDVEVNALQEAQAINARGVYLVGKLKDIQPKSLDTVVQLVLQPENEGEKVQTFSLQKLNDLQSKLMLVAGKADLQKGEVERFVEIFDGVTRLGNTYLKICAAGSILFKDWNAQFFCNPESKLSLLMVFGLVDHRLKGLSREKDVIGHLHSICTFMDGCLSDWQHYIDKQREKYYHLNHFTTTQLVILRNEIAKICGSEDESPSHFIYPMLECVRQDCRPEHLDEALSDALSELKIKVTQDSAVEMEEQFAQPEKLKTQEEEHKKKEFLEGLKEEGYSGRLIQEALEHFLPDELDAALEWCMEHVMDYIDADDLEKDDLEKDDLEQDGRRMTTNEKEAQQKHQQVRNTITKSLSVMTTEIFSETKPTMHSDLASKLQDVWRRFLTTVSTSVSDYLSVEHLGLMLHHLSAQVKQDINRPLPRYLQKGRPNLMICQQSDVVNMVLSMYMNDETLPLPTTDEILVCTAETTAEEVELLWRRACGDEEGKLFCLMNADLLGYEVSDQAEASLQVIAKDKTNYQLAVVCCSEREHKSRLVTALEASRVEAPIHFPLLAVQKYLHAHFCVEKSPGIIPAAVVDGERSSVRVVRSYRAGMGKSLYCSQLSANMKQVFKRGFDNTVRLSLHTKCVSQSEVLEALKPHVPQPGEGMPTIYHLDIAHEVQEGVDDLLFNLLVLGGIANKEGYMWKRSGLDLYVIETMPLLQRQREDADGSGAPQMVHRVLQLLPTLTCWSPTESKQALTQQANNQQPNLPGWTPLDQLFDQYEFKSASFQRVYQYLRRFANNADLSTVDPFKAEGTSGECLEYLLRYCGIVDPSWAELRHFVWFLSSQLQDCEGSVFCSTAATGEDLPGFLVFVIRFMIQMSKDFATRSLRVAEQTPGFMNHWRQEQAMEHDGDDEELEGFTLRRRWETSPHAYIFFNHDGITMTFLGFNINRQNGDLLDPQTNSVIERSIIKRNLIEGLRRNFVNLSEKFDDLPRGDKILKLCGVMGIEYGHDPDETYELTTDNVKKILAIHMRFRCGIPVIIMGETGCGKTRLIKFMCDLQKPPGMTMKNMLLMKVHGGTSEEDIKNKVREASVLARRNRQHGNIDTVLFFDEANTTEAIGLIKEIMCDHTMDGNPLPNLHGLKIIAAANPYRKHSDEMIHRLEQAGLGYHIQADETSDRLGRIPMRQLVYRVQALPQSMLPLVWDFGQLSTQVEELYIRQIVHRYITEGRLDDVMNLRDVVSSILAASQDFMRRQGDECSFVSLRDIERVMEVMCWFYDHGEHLFGLMDEKPDDQRPTLFNTDQDCEEDEEEEEDDDDDETPDDITRALILALGVCYHACLEKREEYRQHVAPYFKDACHLPPHRAPQIILHQITRCQDIFLDQIELDDNIARNQALKENVFMMLVCIELRIPLFLVGKPGSSKSLAKTIVADAMQGRAAKSNLFRNFKQVHMISFQCSPLATPEGIVSTFHQCAKLQENQNLDEFVSVVVLDEVGLAEDSPRMPLKTLHPLLEDGCAGDEIPRPHMKVAFIGISNWALDPAKTNRGILVQRGVPNERELQDSAEGIAADERVRRHIRPLVPSLAKAYLKLYNTALEIREFFGLRDFYSLVKMICAFVRRSQGLPPTWRQLEHAIRRNFDGLDNVNPMEVFSNIMHNIDKHAQPRGDDPDCTASGLIRGSLQGKGQDSESRYLLILTENYAALGLLQQQLPDIKNAMVIFGSSFPKDQQYTQVCRNINRIKGCMEAGKTVILLNLENLYESLYDALNQYYVEMGGNRFVDLGLGTMRVKCKVHPDFRLIVVAEKQVVYKKFPIPLINRLEKHFLAMTTMLESGQHRIVDILDEWIHRFVTVNIPMHLRRGAGQQPKPGDVFIGFHADTTASIVLQVCKQMPFHPENEDRDEYTAKVIEKAQELLLNCATPEALIRQTQLTPQEADRLARMYVREQKHDSLLQYLQHELLTQQRTPPIFVQVTTHAKLLSGHQDRLQLAEELHLQPQNITIRALQAFDTEQQFCKVLREFFINTEPEDKLLIIQCDSGDKNSDLIACARHNIFNESMQAQHDIDAPSQPPGGGGRRTGMCHVVFVIQLPRVAGGCFVGFQGGKWKSVHIDDLHTQNDKVSMLNLKNQSVSSLFEVAILADRPKTEAGLDLQDLDQGWTEHLLQEALQSVETREEDEEMDLEDMQLHDSDSGLAVESMSSDDVTQSPRSSDLSRDTSNTTFMDIDLPSDDENPSQGNHTVEVPPGGISETPPHGNHTVEVPPGGISTRMEYDLPEKAGDTQELRRQTEESDLPETGLTEVLDVNVLLKSCIQGASSMLSDVCAERTTKRIQLLLSLMDLQTEGEDSLTFLEVVRKRVYLLLKDKETTKSGAMAQQWLSKEAAALDAINKAGTFRRAWRSCLEGKIVPLLAGLLAYADTNHNLDLLTLTLPDWKTHLWLQMMFDPKMTPLTYSDLQSAQERAELTKFSVKMLGCGGQTMNNKLPFSWVIKSHIEELHHQVKTSPSHVENLGPFLCVMVERGPLGGALDAAYASVGKDEVVDTYVQDFVRMMYTSNSQTPDIEYQLVMGAIHDAMRELGVDQEPLVAVKGTMSKSLPAVHIAYSAICGRMQHLSLLVKAWPECISRLWNFVSSQPDHPLNTDQEMTLDILALQCVLEELTPKPHQTRDARGRLRWLQRVEELQPVIERILASVTQHGYHSSSYGPKCQQVALQQRHIWQRMRAVQLFYEYVLHPGRKEDQLSKFPIPIWKTLKDDCNFKTAATMQAVQKILQTVNKNASKFFLKLDSPCCMCEEPMKDPVLLPCEHIVCQSCLKDLKLNGDLTCPQCNVPYPEGFDISPMEDKREAIEAHNQYKRRCNTFFMELVSQLCFGEGGPPEPAVIENLMCCVTRQSRRDETARLRTTKKLTIFDDCIDPTPVVRSVLLQLLLRSNIEVVREHLGQYLYQAQQLLHEEEEIVQLGILFIQCLEDSHHSEMMQQENTDGATITKAIRELRNARTQMREPGLNIGPIESIAQIRFCLAVTASWMHRVYIARDDGMTLPDVKRLCDAASYICDSRDVKWPRIYLLRILARQYGMEAIKKLSKIPNLRWLMPPDARKDEDEVSADRFVVYGDQYKEIRNSTAQVMLVANTTVIDEAVKEVGAAESGTLLQLSLYREVTGTLTRQTLAKLQTYCQGAAYLTQKEFAERILSNQIGRSCHHLNGAVGEESEDRMLAEIVVHFSIIKDRLPVCALMQPLLTIMDRPQTMQKAMFPTMPQDDLVEIHEALLKARHDVRNADTNPVVWKCPNGHYYIIGDCGRPQYQRPCPTCGAQIGGTNYNPAAGNINVTQLYVHSCGRPYAHRPCPDCGSMIGGQNHIPAHGNIKSTVIDTTGLGYILGAPGQRRTEAIPERHMSPATTALLKFLLHAAMYHATDTKPREVASLIKPAIPAEGVAQFLWMHMKSDLEVIAKATGHSLEDSATCLHLLVKYLVTPPPGGVTVDPTLSNKAARQSWEDAFSKAYILPVLTDLDGQLHAANQAIVNDNRLGNNLLMKLLYETDICIEPEPDLNDVYNVEAFWRFRPRISLQHLTHHLNEHIAACRDNQNQVPRVLQRFLQLEHHLQVMRCLPNIVRLLRMLTQRYNRRIDHHEATSLKLQDFLRKLPRGAVRDEYSTLIEDFAKAWNCIRGSLHTFTFSNMVVPKEYCDEEIGDQTRLALLLPSMKGEGICATGLVHYLVTLHNDFMEEYCHIKGHKFDTVMTLDQVTPANVIFYDPDRDLLPLVMANCNYSLAVGQSTTITYDFNAVETQLEERLLRGKPKLEMMIEHVIFREDMTSATVFSRLEEKIKQEEMTPMTAKNIRHDLQHLPEVSQCLADLDIAMGFLTSVGGEPHSPLVAFMEKTLKMDVTICSPQIRSCQLCHVKSLWLLLSHERTKMLLNYGQDVFDQIEEPFLEVMEGNARDGLQVALQRTNVDVFLAQLYECILLQITTKQDVNDEDYVDYTNIPLRDLLIQYMAEKEQHPELAALENGHFPGEILGKHCVDVWRVAFTYGKQRR